MTKEDLQRANEIDLFLDNSSRRLKDLQKAKRNIGFIDKDCLFLNPDYNPSIDIRVEGITCQVDEKYLLQAIDKTIEDIVAKQDQLQKEFNEL